MENKKEELSKEHDKELIIWERLVEEGKICDNKEFVDKQWAKVVNLQKEIINLTFEPTSTTPL